MSRSHSAAFIALFVAAAVVRGQDPAAAIDADPWPRTHTTPSGALTIYQPQVDAWQGNLLTFHCAVSFQYSPKSPAMFGVIYASARTEVDKDTRTVTLEDMKITGAKFPAHPDSVPSYLRAIRPSVPTAARTISLDRLQASLLIITNQNKVKTVPVKNVPPAIILSPVPAMLVAVDGAPVLGAVPNSEVQRVLNTGVLMAYTGYTYYLRVFDGWMQAVQLGGPWAVSYEPPAQLDQVLAWAKTQHIDLLTGTGPDATEPAPSLWTGTIPVIYTSTTPAELIVTQGAPDWVPVEGTDLLYVKNTSAHLFEDIDDQQMYALISGRWFTAPALIGPWKYVPGAQLPLDFWHIPLDSPVEPVLASVPGTPQAQEALIENSVPQTGAVSLTTVMPAPVIDGAVVMKAIPGTNLSYVANAPLPIIRTGPSAYYAVYNGAWFAAPSPQGPWMITAYVPAVIYTIPPSSPVYYATYVQVYGATSTVVYVGYTPGYYGTVVVSGGVVVYGTGYVYAPWVGAYYYPPPMTYGYGASLAWTPYTGWVVVYGVGYPYGGVAVAMTYGGAMWGVHPYYGPYYASPYYAHGYAAATTGNVYTHYGSTSAMTHQSAAYNPYTGQGYSQKYGSSYNSATGVAANGQRTTTANAYTGNYQSYASGSAYSTKTGASATGYTNTYGNAYTGQQTKTGQATVTGASGQTANVSAVQTDNGGAVKVNNNVYGDANGNVYKQTGSGSSSSWSQYSGTSKSSGSDSWSNYSGSSASGAQKGGASQSSLNSQSWSRSAGASRSSSYSHSRQ
jgi:hypothetical protein